MSKVEILPKEFELSVENKTLSRRELEVLLLVAGGFENSEIAEIFEVQLTTVKKQLERIYKKLKAKNRANAVFMAYFDGLIVARDYSAVMNCERVKEILSKKV
ncbi:MAG: hypothetical protein DKM23_08620 [Candidatus Melainabacteria bacterium]|nr:MAG: hypothetical protein DKM24_08335 [Candidatus Melainabacteria bacterium]RAI09556.1 MAG: hypothetical protein DKM23_08620 [Candidatus Melainabacteria bacterium]